MLQSTNNNEESLVSKLRQWALRTNVPHFAVIDLLHTLLPYHPELPLDCRTLLQTPNKLSKKKLNNGEFCYFGIQQQLLNLLQKLNNSAVSISFNVDGLPLFHSSDVSLWPILCLTKNFNCEPFVVGIFCGTGKPDPLELFLEEFINGLNCIVINGITVKGQKVIVSIHSFICDAPTRAYLKSIKNHTGYSSYEKCTEIGEYYNGRVIFNGSSSSKRTHHSFVNKLDENHHTGKSPLVNLTSLDLTGDLPIDY